MLQNISRPEILQGFVLTGSELKIEIVVDGVFAARVLVLHLLLVVVHVGNLKNFLISSVDCSVMELFSTRSYFWLDRWLSHSTTL